ncbi:hypothetical protein DYB36_003755 [Aphanomyces astaci]|uniref:UDP-N-acetylglucosamine transferase subunit ALG14 n=1 Tax=Aphanomyces astaci TaxID=112090 RepID=A0A397AR60_APHAT|nr:hypothetical protein DYB36_003755 [Aphanomyces astaci]
MLKLIKRLSMDTYAPLAFVVAASDHTSEEKARVERKVLSTDQRRLPWPITASRTMEPFTSTRFLAVERSGSRTCIPICAALLVRRFLGLQPSSKLIFCESFARVQRLSLSGRLLYHVADAFVVHWPQLQAKYPHATYLGTIC